MSRIVYVSPDSNAPTGGIKVIYRHVELLRAQGVEACVLHFKRGFRCDWFANTAPVIALEDLRTTDLVMVPEIMTVLGNQLQGMGIRYGLFVQNGYLVLPTAPMADIERCYRHAELVLSISDDTTGMLTGVFPFLHDKIVRVKYSVDTSRFRPAAEKLRLVTYMPRKLPLHAQNVVPWLSHRFPDWQFIALHGLSEDQVALALGRSRIFLAFSDFEGCPVPPLEAALAGNVVLGYPGWGGQEYWREPIFRAVRFGDVRDFVRKFHEVADFATQASTDALLTPARGQLALDWGLEAETALLMRAVARLQHSALKEAA